MMRLVGAAAGAAWYFADGFGIAQWVWATGDAAIGQPTRLFPLDFGYGHGALAAAADLRRPR